MQFVCSYIKRKSCNFKIAVTIFDIECNLINDEKGVTVEITNFEFKTFFDSPT